MTSRAVEGDQPHSQYERDNNRPNNLRSVGPGVLVTYRDFNYRGNGRLSAPNIKDSRLPSEIEPEITDHSGYIFSAYFPEGAYYIDEDSKVHLCAQAEIQVTDTDPQFLGWTEGAAQFTIGAEDVLQIQGDHGELWASSDEASRRIMEIIEQQSATEQD